MPKPFITIVSGLPRSGTSMMMQAIEAGGLPALTDNIRTKDEDNPRGYYEFEPVKKTKDDPSWVPEAKGKVVKMVYRLLYELPADFEYRVIFMERNLDEVLASQKKMLKRTSRQGANVDDEKLTELYENELAKFKRWINDQKNMSMLTIKYQDMVAAPMEQVQKISTYLGEGLDVQAMASAVDPALYRNRA